ncbi:hypothetical protein QL285_060253 [Trifolium repens]|nr:hypothetical protein QL285_060253 [Trifolium repens]
MEPAKIDWKNLEWNFTVDELYEHLNAPKFVDFLSLNHNNNNNDDEAWFCKPDCNHPKTAEDFLRSPSPFKARSPFYLSENLSSGGQNRRRPDETENMPMTLDLENVRQKRENSLQQIRTNPPSPQCFSAGLTKTNPSKGSKSRLMERGILEELVQQNKEVAKDTPAQNSKSITIIDGRETKALDMFWFFKPCTTMSS